MMFELSILSSFFLLPRETVFKNSLYETFDFTNAVLRNFDTQEIEKAAERGELTELVLMVIWNRLDVARRDVCKASVLNHVTYSYRLYRLFISMYNSGSYSLHLLLCTLLLSKVWLLLDVLFGLLDKITIVEGKEKAFQKSLKMNF